MTDADLDRRVCELSDADVLEMASLGNSPSMSDLAYYVAAGSQQEVYRTGTQGRAENHAARFAAQLRESICERC